MDPNNAQRKMSCSFALANANPPSDFSSSYPNRFGPKSLIPKSISFASRSPNPPRRGSVAIRIAASTHGAPAVSLYELLGLSESGSTISDIKKAYKQKARMYHPDVSEPERVEEHTRRFIMVTEAYEILSDPEMRASYDRDLATGLGSNFSGRRNYQSHQGTGEWKMRWESQLEELKRRSDDPSTGKTSWAARMRMILINT